MSEKGNKDISNFSLFDFRDNCPACNNGKLDIVGAYTTETKWIFPKKCDNPECDYEKAD